MYAEPSRNSVIRGLIGQAKSLPDSPGMRERITNAATRNGTIIAASARVSGAIWSRCSSIRVIPLRIVEVNRPRLDYALSELEVGDPEVRCRSLVRDLQIARAGP